MLQRREILRYDETIVKQFIFNEDMTKVVACLGHGDILVVIADEDRPFIKVMLPNGLTGWTRFIHHRFLKFEHQVRDWSEL